MKELIISIFVALLLNFLPCSYFKVRLQLEGFDTVAEADEVAEILANFGLEPSEYWPVVEALRKRPDAWIDFMMRYVPLHIRMNVGREFDIYRFVLAMAIFLTLAFSNALESSSILDDHF